MTLLTSLALAAVVAAAPKAEFDHSHGRWNALLVEFVHTGGRVNYRGLARKRSQLDRYLGDLRSVRYPDFKKWTGPEREAFWINAYNAYTVQLILDNYPVKSIRDLGGWFSPVWDKRFIPLQHLSREHGKVLSLGEIEHEILAKKARQPLFHFAIVCASGGCPELRAEAYTAKLLDKQLGNAGRTFLADTSKNGQEVLGGKLRVSKIFKWSEDELQEYPGGITKLLADFAPKPVSEALRRGRVRLEYGDYDWSLNEWVPPAVKSDLGLGGGH